MDEKDRLIQNYDLQQHISEGATNARSRSNYKVHPYESFRTRARNKDTTISTVNSLKCDLRIVLIGKTGSGKSTTGNTIMGRKEFREAISPNGVTKTCQRKELEVSEKQLSVVDTPGIFDASMTPEKLKSEIEQCIYMSAPGPHAFLLVLRLDVRITEEEMNTVKWIQKNFGEDAAKYTIILFTHADVLRNQTLDEYITQSLYLQELIESCCGRYHSFNNQDVENRSQVTKLLEKIEEMLEVNGEEHYTNEMYQRVQKILKFWSEKPRIVLLGKPGSGKSATGNTILCRNGFTINNAQGPGTQTCEQQERSLEKKNFSVIDTPGLMDASIRKKKVKSEIEKCVLMSAPGPHVFLLVIRLDEDFTDEEINTARWIQENIGEDAAGHTIILFTRVDQMQDRSVDEYIRESSDLQALVHSCGGRYHTFNNEDKHNLDQVTELLKKIETLAESNDWKCFTNERFQKIIKRNKGSGCAQINGLMIGSVGSVFIITGGVMLGVMNLIIAPAILLAGGGAAFVTGFGTAGVLACKKKGG